MDLKNKVVLITGSSQGIGKATAQAFAQQGGKVIVTYNANKKEGEATLQACKKHRAAELFHLNVLDDSSIHALVKEITKRYGKLDILINNAGVLAGWNSFTQQTFADLERQVSVNLTGLMKVTHAFLPLLQHQKEALIINIASMAGKEVYDQIVPYCATKFGVRGFTQALALELPKHINIYCINPGMTATQMTKYEGVDPDKVAAVIVKTAQETLGKKSGDDVDVPDYL